ncbi:MAG: TonB-dependent receptor [Thermodesulfovibrionales bacterium]
MTKRTKLCGLAVAVLLCLMPVVGYAYLGDRDFTGLSIEDLMSIEITSAGKKAQRLSDSATAVFVISQEDIRRSGVTSIPEALRMVPGLEVARINSSTWAISSRGFNGRFANKLLVLIDGRSVYSPLFSGVFWDVQDTLLADIERIEVIRGPGASLWGANAVNGVINIITKNAEDTKGGLFSAGGGTEERYFAGLRYGSEVSAGTYLRAYAKHFSRSSLADASGRETFDGWHKSQGGFRLDVNKWDRDSLTIQGDIYSGREKGTTSLASFDPPFTNSINDTPTLAGGNVLARWKHSFSDVSDMEAQFYYNRASTRDVTLTEKHDTVDFDMQHRIVLAERHEIVWGAGYRFTKNITSGSFAVTFEPDSKRTNLFSAFAQDDMTLIKDRLHFVLGSKIEHNDFTGFEIQPTARVIWKPHEHHTVWAAVSRAVRTPSDADRGATANPFVIPPGTSLNPGPLPVVTRFRGSQDFMSEKLIAYEAGYRVVPTSNLSVDAAVFYNVYDKLRTTEPGTPFLEVDSFVPHLVVPISAANNAKGKTYGVELSVDWRPLSFWRIQTAYTFLEMHLHRNEGSADTTIEQIAGNNPRHQVSLRSSLDLRSDLELDGWLRYVSDLPAVGIKSYVTLDTRIAWRPVKRLEISIVGQNLLDNRHPEQATEVYLATQPTEIRRGFYGKVTWGF